MESFTNGQTWKEATYRKESKYRGLYTFKGEVVQFEKINGKAVRLWSYICKSDRLNKTDAIKDALHEKEYV
jgi:hypothetical protein